MKHFDDILRVVLSTFLNASVIIFLFSFHTQIQNKNRILIQQEILEKVEANRELETCKQNSSNLIEKTSNQ